MFVSKNKINYATVTLIFDFSNAILLLIIFCVIIIIMFILVQVTMISHQQFLSRMRHPLHRHHCLFEQRFHQHTLYRGCNVYISLLHYWKSPWFTIFVHLRIWNYELWLEKLCCDNNNRLEQRETHLHLVFCKEYRQLNVARHRPFNLHKKKGTIL